MLVKIRQCGHFRIVHKLIDQAYAQCLIRANTTPGQQQIFGSCSTDTRRQQAGSCRCEYRQLDLGLTQFGLWGSKKLTTCQRYFQTTTEIES